MCSQNFPNRLEYVDDLHAIFSHCLTGKSWIWKAQINIYRYLPINAKYTRTRASTHALVDILKHQFTHSLKKKGKIKIISAETQCTVDMFSKMCRWCERFASENQATTLFNTDAFAHRLTSNIDDRKTHRNKKKILYDRTEKTYPALFSNPILIYVTRQKTA